MVEPVDRMIEMFTEAGADIVTFHPEASGHVDRSLDLIKKKGRQRPAWCSTRRRRSRRSTG